MIYLSTKSDRSPRDRRMPSFNFYNERLTQWRSRNKQLQLAKKCYTNKTSFGFLPNKELHLAADKQRKNRLADLKTCSRSDICILKRADATIFIVHFIHPIMDAVRRCQHPPAHEHENPIHKHILCDFSLS